MEITYVYTLDLLTTDSVSVVIEKYIQLDEESDPVQIGKRNRVAYVNSAHDRAVLEEKLPESHYNAVIAMWGDEPTVPDIDGELQ